MNYNTVAMMASSNRWHSHEAMRKHAEERNHSSELLERSRRNEESSSLKPLPTTPISPRKASKNPYASYLAATYSPHSPLPPSSTTTDGGMIKSGAVKVCVAPYLYQADTEGWVMFREKLVFVRWGKYWPVPGPADFVKKMNIERVCVEAACQKGETWVEIRSVPHRIDNEGTTVRPDNTIYDLHVNVYFPKLKREAHVYVERHENDELEKRSLVLKRRGGLPTIVLC